MQILKSHAIKLIIIVIYSKSRQSWTYSRDLFANLVVANILYLYHIFVEYTQM